MWHFHGSAEIRTDNQGEVEGQQTDTSLSVEALADEYKERFWIDKTMPNYQSRRISIHA